MNPILFNILFKKTKHNHQEERIRYYNEWSERIENRLATQFHEHFRMSKSKFNTIKKSLFDHVKNISQEEFRLRLLVALTCISHKVAYRMIKSSLDYHYHRHSGKLIIFYIYIYSNQWLFIYKTS